MNTVLLTQLFQFIVGLVALILLHEFGHFIVARLMKVQIEEFGIGFPPRIVKLFEAGGTEFTLNWIPLGGFVRPKGENDPSVPGGLAASSPWVRLGVLLAGPGMNLLIGVLLGILLFYSLGDPIRTSPSW
jgi:regulator of sigma E protease